MAAWQGGAKGANSKAHTCVDGAVWTLQGAVAVHAAIVPVAAVHSASGPGVLSLAFLHAPLRSRTAVGAITGSTSVLRYAPKHHKAAPATRHRSLTHQPTDTRPRPAAARPASHLSHAATCH